MNPEKGESLAIPDLRAHLPEMAHLVRRHHYLPHGYVLAAVHGIRSGWRLSESVPQSLRASFRRAMGICMALVGLQSVWIGMLRGPEKGALILAVSLIWNAILFPLLRSQLSLVRPPESKVTFPSFGLPNLLTLYRLTHLPLLLLATVMLVEYDPAGRPSTHPLLLLLYASVALSDTLDGLFARLLGRVSEFGRVYDPMCDILVFVSSSIGFWLAGMLPTPVMILVLFRFGLPLFGGSFVYVFVGPFSIRPTLTGKLAVFALATYLGCLLLHACLSGIGVSGLCDILMWVTVGTLALHVVLTLRKGLGMIREATKTRPKDQVP